MVMICISMSGRGRDFRNTSLLLLQGKLLKLLSIFIQSKSYIETLNQIISWLCFALKVSYSLVPPSPKIETMMKKISKILKSSILDCLIIFQSWRRVKRGKEQLVHPTILLLKLYQEGLQHSRQILLQLVPSFISCKIISNIV